MGTEWALGTGPDVRVFGPGSIQVIDMIDAPGVNDAREIFYAKNGATGMEHVTNYAARFGASDYFTTSSPTQQFVGSYRVDVFAVNQSQAMFVVNNTSSLKSLTAGVGPAYERSTFGPGGNMRQTYWWTEPRRQ